MKNTFIIGFLIIAGMQVFCQELIISKVELFRLDSTEGAKNIKDRQYIKALYNCTSYYAEIETRPNKHERKEGILSKTIFIHGIEHFHDERKIVKIPACTVKYIEKRDSIKKSIRLSEENRQENKYKQEQEKIKEYENNKEAERQATYNAEVKAEALYKESLQKKEVLYKADYWADTKGKGSFAKAMDNPTYQKVEILKTDTNFKITFGAKVYNYAIVSSKPFSEFRMDYNVTHNGKNYVLAICLMPDNKIVIGIEGIWMIPDAHLIE